MTKNKKFPKEFLWGASTAAHQVEGGNHNQWTIWELENASRLAKEAGGKNNAVSLAKKDLKIWPEVERFATDPENYISGQGVDHYNLFRNDFQILNDLNMKALRFSVEWSRIEPEKGRWDKSEVDHYHQYIDELLKHGIEPILNIWHWTMPVWFCDEGEFTKRSNIQYFERFVQKIIDEYGDKLRYIITINEANTYVMMGYILGMWPPMKKNFIMGSYVYYNLTIAHKRAYKLIKSKYPNLLVGLAHQGAVNMPYHRLNPLENLIAWGSDYFWYEWFYNRCRKYQDFVGSNFYQANYIDGFKIKNPSEPVSDIGWYLEPRAIGKLISKLYKKYKKPVLITENGIADINDEKRQWWIEQTIMGMNDAMDEGAQMVGYLHWSLLDNFEWAEGWWLKFGLVEVDRKNGMKRTVRPSAKWLAKEIDKISEN